MAMISVDEVKLRALLGGLPGVDEGGMSIDDRIHDLRGEDDPSSYLYWYRASVVSVYDGDTIRADWDLGANVLTKNERFRFLGINAPEKRGETKERGIVVRDRLRELVLGKSVIINTRKHKKGKYGRYLATIYLERDDGTWMNVNQHLEDSFTDVVHYPKINPGDGG